MALPATSEIADPGGWTRQERQRVLRQLRLLRDHSVNFYMRLNDRNPRSRASRTRSAACMSAAAKELWCIAAGLRRRK